MTIWQALNANAFYILGIGFVVSLMIWGRRKLVDNDSDQITDPDECMSGWDLDLVETPSPVVRRGSIGRTE